MANEATIFGWLILPESSPRSIETSGGLHSLRLLAECEIFRFKIELETTC